jgi:hypothetical protein
MLLQIHSSEELNPPKKKEKSSRIIGLVNYLVERSKYKLSNATARYRKTTSHIAVLLKIKGKKD